MESCDLLNRANRYLPILDMVGRFTKPGRKLLDLGSGSLGIGEFFSGAFIGCDLRFDRKPVKNMIPLVASLAGLPFADCSFDVVIASDVFEHIPPNERKHALAEVLRVAGRLAVIGFPSGEKAFAADSWLMELYRSKGLPVPEWLSEHMVHGFPDERICDGLGKNFAVTVVENEAISYHLAVMKFEMWRLGRAISIVLARFAPWLCSRVVRRLSFQPSYRKILCIERVA